MLVSTGVHTRPQAFGTRSQEISCEIAPALSSGVTPRGGLAAVRAVAPSSGAFVCRVDEKRVNGSGGLPRSCSVGGL